MSFSMVCVGQEVLPQPGAFDFAFQRTGALNLQTLAMEQGDLSLFALLLSFAGNNKELLSSQPWPESA